MSDHAEVEHNPVVIAIIYMEKSFLIERNNYRNQRSKMILNKRKKRVMREKRSDAIEGS